MASYCTTSHVTYDRTSSASCSAAISARPAPFCRHHEYNTRINHNLSRRGNHRKAKTIAWALIPVQVLNPLKVSVSYLSPVARQPVDTLSDLATRRYTVTHNDLTGHLYISVGEEFNEQQYGGWYSRLVRDEVLGEWCFTGGLALHLHCHISGNAFSLVPSGYRNFVFRREMPLVIDSIAYAEKWFNPATGVPPSLQSVPIFVHFESGDPRLSRVECWGCLGEWVGRESALGTVKHIESVSRTLPGVIPAVPVAFMAGGERGSLQLDGKLERFMVAFDSFMASGAAPEVILCREPSSDEPSVEPSVDAPHQEGADDAVTQPSRLSQTDLAEEVMIQGTSEQLQPDLLLSELQCTELVVEMAVQQSIPGPQTGALLFDLAAQFSAPYSGMEESPFTLQESGVLLNLVPSGLGSAEEAEHTGASADIDTISSTEAAQACVAVLTRDDRLDSHHPVQACTDDQSRISSGLDCSSDLDVETNNGGECRAVDVGLASQASRDDGQSAGVAACAAAVPLGGDGMPSVSTTMDALLSQDDSCFCDSFVRHDAAASHESSCVCTSTDSRAMPAGVSTTAVNADGTLTPQSHADDYLCVPAVGYAGVDITASEVNTAASPVSDPPGIQRPVLATGVLRRGDILRVRSNSTGKHHSSSCQHLSRWMFHSFIHLDARVPTA